MDITKFIIDTRRELLDYEDYATYAIRLSTRLRSCKKRLNIPDKNPAKHLSNFDVSPAKLAQNHEFIHVPLLTVERRWAKAMKIKARDAISRESRKQIQTKLVTGAEKIDELVKTLSDSTSGANTTDVLEARAYAALLRGIANFEKKSWQQCLENYSIAKIVYTALSTSMDGSLFKELLSDTIDPSLRYCQHQLSISTSNSIHALARQNFPTSDAALVSSVNEIDAAALKEDEDVVMSDGGALRTLTWRSREVHIADAEIALKWDLLEKASSELSGKLSSSPDLRPTSKADAYDGVLEASQDAVDAAQRAMDELKEQGVSQSDSRMQNLAVIRTKLNYERLSWMIGRNRVMMGDKDGVLAGEGPSTKKKLKTVEESEIAEHEAAPSRQVKHLKDKVKLYDTTLQSLEATKDLPGVAADQVLSAELHAISKYFTSLKSLAMARAHTLVGNPANGLALTKHASEQCEAAMPILFEHAGGSKSGVKNIEVTRSDAESLRDTLKGELQRSRALVEMSNLKKQKDKGNAKIVPRPLVDRLGQYPVGGVVDLENIVPYPPKLEPLATKPLFLDVAWNYVRYPDKQGASATGAAQSKAPQKTSAKEEQPAKKGWFGFGR